MLNLFTLPNKVNVTLEKADGTSETKEFYNMTCTKGRASIARRLVDNTTADLWVAKYIAIGDSSTPATESDLILWNEVRREAIKTADTVLQDNVVKVYARFGTGFSGTVREAGLFIDQNATAINGSWSLLAHSVFTSPITKLTDEVMTIERTVSIVNTII